MQLSESNQQPRSPVFEFDYVKDPLLQKDVHEGYWKLHETAPAVFWTPLNGGHWVLNSRASVNQVLKHPAQFTSRYVTIPATTYTPVIIPTTLDPPDHPRYRRMLHPFFEPKVIRVLEPRIVEWTNLLIDEVIDRKECEFVDAIASRLPVFVFMELMGLPLDKFNEFRTLVVSYFDAILDMVERGRRAEEIHGHLASLIAARRAEPKDDLISKLLSVDFEGRKLNPEELKSICFNMFVAGLDTVVNGMTFSMRHLAGDEALRQRIIDEPTCVGSLADELLRAYSVVNTRRYVVEDVVVEGVQMRTGDPILVPTMMVGWDEQLNSCPHQVSVDRGPPRHGAFGVGIHSCLGIHLARAELQTFYRLWFERIGHFRLADPTAPLSMRAGTVMAIRRLNLVWG
jgi:cytochrome P450